MKKIILFIVVSVLLVSCKKSCYEFAVKTIVNSKDYSKVSVEYQEQCNLTNKQAYEMAKSLEDSYETGVGADRITIVKTCTFYLQ